MMFLKWYRKISILIVLFLEESKTSWFSFEICLIHMIIHGPPWMILNLSCLGHPNFRKKASSHYPAHQIIYSRRSLPSIVFCTFNHIHTLSFSVLLSIIIHTCQIKSWKKGEKPIQVLKTSLPLLYCTNGPQVP